MRYEEEMYNLLLAIYRGTGVDCFKTMKGFTHGNEVITGTEINDLISFKIAPKIAMIIELKKNL